MYKIRAGVSVPIMGYMYQDIRCIKLERESACLLWDARTSTSNIQNKNLN